MTNSGYHGWSWRFWWHWFSRVMYLENHRWSSMSTHHRWKHVNCVRWSPVNTDVTKTSVKIDAERLKSWIFMVDFRKSKKIHVTCLISQRIIGEFPWKCVFTDESSVSSYITHGSRWNCEFWTRWEDGWERRWISWSIDDRSSIHSMFWKIVRSRRNVAWWLFELRDRVLYEWRIILGLEIHTSSILIKKNTNGRMQQTWMTISSALLIPSVVTGNCASDWPW